MDSLSPLKRKRETERPAPVSESKTDAADDLASVDGGVKDKFSPVKDWRDEDIHAPDSDIKKAVGLVDDDDDDEDDDEDEEEKEKLKEEKASMLADIVHKLKDIGILPVKNGDPILLDPCDAKQYKLFKKIRYVSTAVNINIVIF